jgi:hypothetical protein
MKPYKFLLDRDVSKALSLFPRKRARTIAQAKLKSNASDTQIVERAHELACTIVTANGDDFYREIIKFQKTTKRSAYGEMNGLVVLSSGYERQKRMLENAEAQLWFGNQRLSWSDIWEGNYYVRLRKDNKPEVKRLPRCLYCEKHTKAS